MSKKLLSMSTTVRNPYRIKDFLSVLNSLDGVTWNHENQKQFQILLIQNRFYTPENKGLTEQQQSWLESPELMNYQQAKEIFDAKNYTDSPMRGRTSFKPLEKSGLAFIVNECVKITDFGKRLINGEIEVDDFCFSKSDFVAISQSVIH